MKEERPNGKQVPDLGNLNDGLPKELTWKPTGMPLKLMLGYM